MLFVCFTQFPQKKLIYASALEALSLTTDSNFASSCFFWNLKVLDEGTRKHLDDI
jgi:hypothetical protein